MSEPAKPPTNPETPAGMPGRSHDGTEIPADQMVDDRERGSNPEALRRFQNGATDSATLLAMLRGAASPRKAHRPAVMLRGDMNPRELQRLRTIYGKLCKLVSNQVRLSPMAYSLFIMLAALIGREGYVDTDDVRSTTLAAYGFDRPAMDAFDTALGIVWSLATTSPYSILPHMEEAVRNLIEELGMENDLI